jgi:hypothetical protein
MNLISTDTLAAFTSRIDERLESLDASHGVDLHNPRYGPPFRWYLLFTHASDLLPEISTADVFYNRYVWFRRFAAMYRIVHGEDAGIEQQLFHLLEDAPPGIDWSQVEKIDALVKSES